jgi:hypothetical protein
VPSLATAVLPKRVGSEYMRTSKVDRGSRPSPPTLNESPGNPATPPSDESEVTDPSDDSIFTTIDNAGVETFSSLFRRVISTGTFFPSICMTAAASPNSGMSITESCSTVVDGEMVVVVASTVGGTELSPDTGSVEVEKVVVDVRGCVVDVDELATVVVDDGATVVLLDDVEEVDDDVLVTDAEIVTVVALCVVGGPVFIATSVRLFAES